MDPNLQSGVIDTTMPTTTNKQRLLTQIFAHLPKAAKGGPDSHAGPLDTPTLRVLRRLALTDGDQDDLEALRAGLEHHIPKAKGPLFNDLISALADEVCHEDEPNCPACPLSSCCPTAHEIKAAV